MNTCGQLIFKKNSKAIEQRKKIKINFSTSVAGTTGQLLKRRGQGGGESTQHRLGLSARATTVNLLHANMQNPSDVGLDQDCLGHSKHKP